ncbi:cryptochrome/photolyase family protein [Photobacterium sp. TY1-4]|nr:cryptochrome/photolyase family protein [Photobacterium sp. TY1-4]UXI03513.1 cryptochrome/photolyase family protein [Photobacterium sp. TY1-4]
MSKTNYRTLRLILGDQLNPSHSWYRENQPDTLYLIAELHQEAGYTKHHVQKICAFFAAMQQFAQGLRQAGHHVLHLTLDDTADFESLPMLLNHLIEQYQITHLDFQRPDEYRLYEQLHRLTLPDGVSLREWDSEHFLLPFAELAEQFPRGKSVLMEHFYRRMRKRFDILMADGKPEGGQWNFDKHNRQTFKSADIKAVPAPLLFANDVGDILKRLKRHQVATIGETGDPLLWPVNRQQAKQLLAFFCKQCLPNFGRFQDAMTEHSPHGWSLYHSRLSFTLNSKMLHPMQVIQAVLDAYRAQPDQIDIAQVEGFIRQILGWREYIRGVYWGNMPNYCNHNALDAQRSLPAFFWDGNTKMACMKAAIGQSLSHAYAHHIQRLMVTGNFCLLAGIHPDEVDAWYLGIYVDAIEWVELPNTRGMSQFADHGVVATKPYAASGNYINKMSDYCRDCHYNVKEKLGEQACPLNSLYWHFLHHHDKQLSRNPRIGMIYRSWDQLSPDQQQAVLDRAEYCLAHLSEL